MQLLRRSSRPVHVSLLVGRDVPGDNCVCIYRKFPPGFISADSVDTSVVVLLSSCRRKAAAEMETSRGRIRGEVLGGSGIAAVGQVRP